MRALAARLKLNAATIGASGRGIQNRLRSMTFEGPAAKRFHDRLMARRHDAEGIAGDANELANSLLRAASAAEAALAAWAARVAAIQESAE